MAASTGYVLAAAGITLANEAIFAPMAQGKNANVLQAVNWKIIPATAVAAILLAGIEQISPVFGKGLGILVLIVAVVVPFGNATPPLDNLSKAMGMK